MSTIKNFGRDEEHSLGYKWHSGCFLQQRSINQQLLLNQLSLRTLSIIPIDEGEGTAAKSG